MSDKSAGRRTVEPIRSMDELDQFRLVMKSKSKNATRPSVVKNWDRNLMIFNLGCNTGLRIGDIIKLKVADVAKGVIDIREEKTSKENVVVMNTKIQKELKKFIAKYDLEDWQYLFRSQKKKEGQELPITRERGWQFLKEVERELKLPYRVGTHTMRKTFGFHYYQKTKDAVTLMEMFNHSDISVTLRYIGVTQHMVNKARAGFSL